MKMIPYTLLRRFKYAIFRGLKYCLLALGIVMLLAILLSFTDYPFWAYYWLGTHNSEMESDPDLIVVMGGGGMPSPDGLIRCYYAAETGTQYPQAGIIIAVPADTGLHEESPELLMARELIIRGIDSSRIRYEKNGYNTRTQAINILSVVGMEAADTISVRIITSPEHMMRSVATFRKAGFKYVGGMSSFEKAITEEMLLRKRGDRHDIEDEKQALAIRYNMWNYLKYEITVLREYCAICYYKCRGWM